MKTLAIAALIMAAMLFPAASQAQCGVVSCTIISTNSWFDTIGGVNFWFQYNTYECTISCEQGTNSYSELISVDLTHQKEGCGGVWNGSATSCLYGLTPAKADRPSTWSAIKKLYQ